MVIVRFDNTDEERQALGWLAGRFSFKTWDNGDLMLHEAVLPSSAREGIAFRVQGPATYEHFRPTIRDSAAASWRRVCGRKAPGRPNHASSPAKNSGVGLREM